MFISNITHFLDKNGDIAKDMHPEAKELASFLTFIIEATTDFEAETGFSTEINCIKKGCKGIIRSTILFEKNNEIFWQCPECGEEGTITEWEGTQWDNS